MLVFVFAFLINVYFHRIILEDLPFHERFQSLPITKITHLATISVLDLAAPIHLIPILIFQPLTSQELSVKWVA